MVGDVVAGSATGEFEFAWDLHGLRRTLKATLGKYPASNIIPPTGTVAVEDQSDGSLRVYYNIAGLDTDAVSGGLHIHKGTSCRDNHVNGVGGHYWDATKNSEDPWNGNASYSVAEGGNGNAKGSFAVRSGYTFDDNIDHVVVVHNDAGDRIACAPLVVATAGVHIHSGTTCSREEAVGNHYWKFPDDTEDPWNVVQYNSGETEAKGTANVASGYTLQYNADHAVVVHSAADGARIGCGLIQVWLENTTTTTTSATTTTTSATTTTVVCNGVPDPSDLGCTVT